MKDFQPPGLPEEFRPWEEISKDSQMIKITCDKRRYGKLMTIVEGFDTKDVDINEMAKKLKKKTASGGTVKNGKIELQGDHRDTVKKVLDEMGFNVEVI